MRRRPPRSTLTDTLFPSTTFFRSLECLQMHLRAEYNNTPVRLFVPLSLLHRVIPVLSSEFDATASIQPHTSLPASARKGQSATTKAADRKSTRLNSSH